MWNGNTILNLDSFQFPSPDIPSIAPTLQAGDKYLEPPQKLRIDFESITSIAPNKGTGFDFKFSNGGE